MTVLVDMVREWLERNDYEGLFNPECCACELSDLMPCDEPNFRECEPGYKTECPDDCGEGCLWHIARKV